MENASKALIIAGAILLAILLISLGIMIFNQAQDTVNNSGMTQAEITAFNNKFLKYEGTQKGSVVKSLINEVLATNQTLSDSEKVKVTVTKGNGTAISASATPTTSAVDTAQSYTVKLTYSNGRVTQIDIT
ncbi:MAG: hypothetical protein V8R82_10395 [Clostridia bacterium]